MPKILIQLTSMSTSNFRFVILSFSVLYLGCKPHYQSSKSQFKEIYVNQFKLIYAKQLLRKSYNNSVPINTVLKDDRSGYVEPILTDEDYKYIDSITTVEANKIKIDSIESIGRVAEGAEGKHVLGFLIQRLESTELNRIVKRRCKKAKANAF
jgi:hypothetical protein